MAAQGHNLSNALQDSERRYKEMERKLGFIEFDAQSRAVLRSIKPIVAKHITAAVKKFHDQVGQFSEVRSLFKDSQRMDAMQDVLAKHWIKICDADFDSSYIEAVRKIGQMHVDINFSCDWYQAGSSIILSQLISEIIKESQSKGKKFLPLASRSSSSLSDQVSVLIRAAMIDSGLAISIFVDITDNDSKHIQEEANANTVHSVTVVNQVGAALSELRQGNLTQRISEPFTDSYEPIRQDLNATLNQLQDTMDKILNVTDGIRSGASEIGHAADDLSKRTEQQAASLEETAAALDQVTATVRRTSEGAQQASRAVSLARTDAEHSGAVVKDAVEAMGRIESSARQISQIIGVIDEIAFQTNLLALNAGVEAARAGDAGRGFAVVASEVRALAQRSADAAKEIKSLISASSQEVENGVRLVGQTGESLNGIVTKVLEISDLVQEIAASAQEQANGLGEINAAVNQMDTVTQQNAAMVEQSTAASHNLSNETEELARLISYFNIGNTKSTSASEMRRPILKNLQRRDVNKVDQGQVSQIRTIRSNAAASGASSAAARAVADTDWQEF